MGRGSPSLPLRMSRGSPQAHEQSGPHRSVQPTSYSRPPSGMEITADGGVHVPTAPPLSQNLAQGVGGMGNEAELAMSSALLALGPGVTPYRAKLLAAVFRACDRAGKGSVGELELGRFAQMTGFQGSAYDWHEEYRCICNDNGLDQIRGLSLESFGRLLQDRTEMGIYCTDDELAAAIPKLETAP